MEKKYFTSSEKGQVLLIVIITMIIALTAGLSIASRTITNLKLSKQNEDSQRAFQAATAGIERYLETLTGSSNSDTLSNSSFNTKVVTISESNTVLNNGGLIDQDRGIDLWLSTYPNFALVPSLEGKTLTLYWGAQDQLDNCNDEGNKPSPGLELLFVSNAASPTLTKYTYDPCPSRRPENNFLTPQGTYEVVAPTGGMGPPPPVCPAGVTNYWSLNDDENSINGDVGGVNGTATGTTSVPAVISNGRSFINLNGNDYTANTADAQYVDFGTSPGSFGYSSPFSISFWVKMPPNPLEFKRLITKLDNLVDGRGWAIGALQSTGQIYFNFQSNPSTSYLYAMGSKTLSDDAWHHVVVTYNGNPSAPSAAIYIDGADSLAGQGSTFNTNTPVNSYSSEPFRLGAIESNNFLMFTGQMDEVGIWANKALTLTEAQDLWNSGSGLSCIPAAPTPTPTVPVGFNGETINGTKFYYKTNPITLNSALVMKVIPIYNSSKVSAVLSGGGVFPPQGKVIESTGTSGETKRKVLFYESYPQIPNEILPYSVLSQ